MRSRVLLAAVAPATAILVFGIIYGSLARPLIGAPATMISSLLIFSGAVQFTIAALLSAGAGAGALIVGAMTLNLRNLVLGAVLRPRIEHGPLIRGALAWFLTDEAAGLALASKDDAARTLLIAGAMFHVSWQVGTVLGILGASVENISDAAEAVFPVLFIGLAAASCPSRSIAVRALVAATIAGTAAVLWPEGRGVSAVLAAIAIALPGGEQ
ncbi:MAG: AzlC family ABC transporter permease [Actinomycetota bacterium]